jgi:HTH-type transcriptional regulator/antitoxin HigA
VEANNMTVSELGEVLGSKGVASEVLNGKRSLSKAHILKLARRFHVDPSLFLEKIS